jgi:hypothetical protein
MLGWPMDGISVRMVLKVVADFDDLGGASASLVAWELFVEEERVAAAWEQMLADGLLKPAGRDPGDDEQRWRLTAGGWAARWEHAGGG